ncbi:hypothetical protein HNQ91_004479 [Filimonas zeae]|nr:hypothetical protein [Filimonas zeae]
MAADFSVAIVFYAVTSFKTIRKLFISVSGTPV